MLFLSDQKDKEIIILLKRYSAINIDIYPIPHFIQYLEYPTSASDYDG